MHELSESRFHADHEDETWELTVHDNGVGFDGGKASFGFGLREQVFSALERGNLSVTLTSASNAGTLVTIMGKTS